jgi:hypothetical protein
MSQPIRTAEYFCRGLCSPIVLVKRLTMHLMRRPLSCDVRCKEAQPTLADQNQKHESPAVSRNALASYLQPALLLQTEPVAHLITSNPRTSISELLWED